MPYVPKSKKGASLMEAVVAAVVLLVVILGHTLTFQHARGQIHLRKQSRAVVQLASQKLEELKAADYQTLTTGEVEEQVTLDDLSCRRVTDVSLQGSYKMVKVTTFWQQRGQEHDISLVTFLSPALGGTHESP